MLSRRHFVLPLLATAAQAQTAPGKTPPNMFPVKPVAAPGANLRLAKGQYFSYALPEGWRLGEDGQFALTLMAPDNKALTVMVGNAGLPPNYNPSQFVFEKLSALRPESLRLGQPQRATPVHGFAAAYQFEVTYAILGVPCRGIAKCNINVAYDTAVMAMTAALSDASQWPGYSTWRGNW